METLLMSVKERRRLAVLSQVISGDMSVAGAGRQLGLSERQIRRVWQRYRRDGDSGLIHGLRGRSGNRRSDPAVRAQAGGLCREHYADFGPTLAAEHLAEHHGLVIPVRTLGRWLTAAKLWRARDRRPPKRQRRPRREHFGELVQLDGSPHDWFETGQTSGHCCLMVMVDDATGWTRARFFEQETTVAAMTVVRDWSLEHGLPQAIYPDRHSVYRRNDKEADAIADRTGKRPPTQFGRALEELGVALIWARSPQAKGRVERKNRVLQDRLVKALRLAGIRDMDAANAYLRDVFLPRLNERFTVAPSQSADLHVPTSAEQLDAALVHREPRRVGQDQCVNFEGQVLQLRPDPGVRSLAGKQVQVQRTLSGELRVLWRDHVVPCTPAALRSRPAKRHSMAAERVATHQPAWKPPRHHPWRAPGVARPLGEGCSAAARAAPSPALRTPRPAA
jgi:transposase